MSTKQPTGDAWDDDWESQADVRSSLLLQGTFTLLPHDCASNLNFDPETSR